MHLHYRRYGSGPALILLHGLFGSLNNWHSHARVFASRCSVYALDQRNHGASPHDSDASYSAMAGDLREFMDEHAIADAVVLGHSMGGKTAMEFAGNHPDRVRALVVVDVALRPYPPKHDQIFAMLESVDLRSHAQREDVEKAMVPFIQNPGVRQFMLTNIARDAEGALRWRMNVPALRAAYSELAASLPPSAPYPGPALFVRGALSAYLVPEDMEDIRKSFPAATMVAIPGARHWVHADAPSLFQQAVLDFLSSID
jgi:esterase